MKKNGTQKIFWTVLSIALYCLIFWFSAQNGEISSAQSGWFRQTFLWFLPEETGSLLIRKAAHFTIYLCYGFSLGRMVQAWRQKEWKSCWWIALLIAALSAAGDEFHQTFVSGRSGQFLDVLLDSAGAMSGILLVLLWETIRKKCQKNQK